MRPWTWTVLLVALCVVGMLAMVLPFAETFTFPRLGLGAWLMVGLFGIAAYSLAVSVYRRGIDQFDRRLVEL